MKKAESLFFKAAAFILTCSLAVCLYVIQVNASQPHMQGALSALQTAKSELNKAEHDKGGHRSKALQHVNQAINEVKKGIAVGSK